MSNMEQHSLNASLKGVKRQPISEGFVHIMEGPVLAPLQDVPIKSGYVVCARNTVVESQESQHIAVLKDV